MYGKRRSWGRDVTVGIVTRYLLDCPEFEPQWMG